MRGIAATFGDVTDAAHARSELGELDPPPAVAGGVLGAAGRKEDGAILLAIHVGDDRVELVRAIVERNGGTVVDVIAIRDV